MPTFLRLSIRFLNYSDSVVLFSILFIYSILFLLIILLSVIRFTISDFPLYYLQTFVRKRNIVRNKLRDSLFSQIIANRSENTVIVPQKTGKGNIKGQSAYFKAFARPCFTGNSRKYNPPYN